MRLKKWKGRWRSAPSLPSRPDQDGQLCLGDSEDTSDLGLDSFRVPLRVQKLPHELGRDLDPAGQVRNTLQVRIDHDFLSVF
jgi:hypothetical protein